MTPINTKLSEAKNRLRALEKIMRAATQEQYDALEPEFIAAIEEVEDILIEKLNNTHNILAARKVIT